MTNPWADPSTPTQEGAPYAGPPPTAPYGYAPAAWAPPYAHQAPYGPPWTPPPRGPQRPAQVITAAVLAFVQGVVVGIIALYLWFFASIANFFSSESQQGFEPGQLAELSREGTVLAVVQLLSAAWLIGAGIWALTGRRRAAWWLLLRDGVQVLLTAYWLVRLFALADTDAGANGSIASLSVFFAAGPLTAIVLLLLRAARQWFGQPANA